MTKSEGMTKSECRNQQLHNSEHFEIRASDFFRHSSFVIQRLVQIRLMVPMHSKKERRLSMNPRFLSARKRHLNLTRMTQRGQASTKGARTSVRFTSGGPEK